MNQLPSGTVTFLFTDIEGSTELVRRLRDRYGGVLAVHQQLVRDAVSEAGGDEIDTQGDSFFFVFRRARDAVLAAANAQRALASHEWPEDGLVRVRMGIHTGEASPVDGHYHGVAVHRAARISAAAHGGQVLLSQTTHNLLEDEEELPLDLRDLGEHRLKDFERPVRIYQLVIPGLQERFPPLRTLAEKPLAVEPAAGELPFWRRLTGRSRAVGAVAGALVAAGIAAALALTLGGESAAAAPHQSVAILDPRRNAVVDAVRLDSIPNHIATGEGGVWAINSEDKTLTKIDPSSRAVVKTVGLPGVPSSVAAGAGGVWVLHSSSSQRTSPGSADARISRIDPGSYSLDTFDPVAAFDDVAYEDPIAVGGSVWISSTGAAGAGSSPSTRGLVARIDPADPTRITRLFPPRAATGLAADGDSAWAATDAGLVPLVPNANPLLAVDGTASTGDAGRAVPRGVSIGEGYVWAVGEAEENPCVAPCGSNGGALWRLDPDTNLIASTKFGAAPNSIAVGAEAVWVGQPHEKSLWKIDPESLQVLAKIKLDNAPGDVAVLGRFVWIAVP